MHARATRTRWIGAALAVWLLWPALASAGQPHVSVVWRSPVHKLAAMAWQPRNPGTAVLAPDGKTVFMAGADGLHALRAATGRQVWHHRTGEAIPGAPLLVDDTLYVVTAGGQVRAVRAKTGEKAWNKPVELGAVVHAGLASDGERIFAVADPGVITAMRRKDGKVIWRNGRTVVREFLVEGHGAALVDGGVVYAGLANGKLVALAARDGGAVWDVTLGDKKSGPYVDIDNTPVMTKVAGKKVVVVTSHNAGMFAVDANSGETRWRYRAEGLGQPYARDGRIYSAAPAGALHVVDANTGKRVLARRLAGAPSGTLAFVGDMVLVPGGRGLQVVSRATGRGVARIVDEFGFSAAPLLAGDSLFALSNGGVAYRLRLRSR